MERYTKRLEDGQAVMDCANCSESWNTNPDGKCTALHCRNRLKDRLATIEDILGDEYELDRLRELVEVRHGRWVPEIHHTYLPVEYDDAGGPILHEYTSYRCSLCGREEAKEEPYCHCGARMDKEDEHETM